MKYFALLFLLFCTFDIYSQDLSNSELDSLYLHFTRIKGINIIDEQAANTTGENPVIKCGLSLVGSIKQNFNYFTPAQQVILSGLLARPNSQKSAVSSNGFFRVHYDTSGNNAIGYDINLFLQALDSVYNFEINFLGYLTPPSDGVEGGDGKYDIYIENLSGTYGYTTYDNNVGISQWTSHINIDNDFGSEFYTHGIDAARVTAAHEFHHAIQMGNYAPDVNPAIAYRNSDHWFYEITSTSFEEFVFDDVNDYYAYLPHYFQLDPSKSITRFENSVDAYDLGIWNIYLQRTFGFEILKEQWKRIPAMSAIKAVALSISNLNSSLKFEINNFGIWCYYTGTRAISGKYFDEASSYPMLHPTASINFNTTSQSCDLSLYPVSNYFLKINLPNSDGTLNAIISNSDWYNAEQNNGSLYQGTYSIFHNPTSGEKRISDNYSVTLLNPDTTIWTHGAILNDVLIFGGNGNTSNNFEGETRVFPNPFKLKSIDDLTIEFKGKLEPNTVVNVNIYSSGLELVYSGEETISIAAENINQVTIKNSLVDYPSGVYIYAVNSGNKIWKGKLVVFND